MASETPHVYTLPLLVYKAESMAETWIAHSLEFNILMQGESVTDALDELTNALASCLLDDLRDGVDPFDERPRADSELWQRFADIVTQGTRVRYEESNDIPDARCFAATARIILQPRENPLTAPSFLEMVASEPRPDHVAV